MPVRVYTTKGLKEQARFGLKNANEVVDYFSEVRYTQLAVIFQAITSFQIFEIDYPLPKLDLLAVPEFVCLQFRISRNFIWTRANLKDDNMFPPS